VTVVQLRALCSEVDERLGTRNAPELLSVSQSRGVIPRSSITDKEPRADDLSRYKVCEIGDIVLNRFNAYRGALGRVTIRGIVSPDYLVLRPTSQGDSGFLAYRLLATDFSHTMKASMGGLGASDPDASGFSRIDVRALLRTPASGLPASQQRQIADYLDTHTVKIDTLIGKQERLIETLAERRQAVISHAVTKGLDPNAPTKDSGQEWLGEVPSLWQVSHLKRKWRVIDCKHVTAEFVDEGIPLASIRESQSKWVDLGAAKQTTEAFYEQLIEGDRKPRARDLIFTRNATVGAVAQVPPDIDRFAVGQDVCILRSLSGAASSDYQQYLLQSCIVSSQIESLLLGSTFKRINVEQIRDFVLPVPGDTEQREIARHLDGEISKIDALSAKAREMIEMLKERRQALISAAVTGKIDVRTAKEPV
jgi:type I restriction enzyme S subunit